MIQLPEDWKQGIQVVDYPRSGATQREIGMVCLILNNDSGQIYGFEMPVAVPLYLKQQLGKSDLVMFYEIAYNTLVQQIPDLAFKMLNAFGRDEITDKMEVQSIKDNDWQVFRDNGNMVDYEEFIGNLKV